MGCFSGCLMSSASIQKLFCGFYSAFKCSFDEFVGEKVVFLSYSSAILGPPLSSLIMYKTLGSTSLPIQPNWNLRIHQSPTRLKICWDHPDSKYSAPSLNLCRITSSSFVVNFWSPTAKPSF